mmetsp:Transcript_27686/g.73133  ORF Transcript_27686/g.73133 Transcript_27686/m.73133 type:complete len:103 (+) Transcript_27686:165-473(+)
MGCGRAARTRGHGPPRRWLRGRKAARLKVFVRMPAPRVLCVQLTVQRKLFVRKAVRKRTRVMVAGEKEVGPWDLDLVTVFDDYEDHTRPKVSAKFVDHLIAD